MSERYQVLEYSTPRVEDGVVKGVKIIGLKSRNGLNYSRPVLRAAKALYESSPVFICHGDKRETKHGSRRLMDHFGSLQNVHERHGSKATFGLFGDLHMKVSHPLAAVVTEAIEDGNANFGLSHNAFVESNKARTQVIEIIAVDSVDLVDRPATTTTLFEEENMATLKEQLAARERGEVETGDDEFRVQVTEEIAAFNTVLETVQEEIKEFRGLLAELREIRTELAKKKPTRITALEEKTGEELEQLELMAAKPIGKSHEDFVGLLQGFPAG